MHAELDVGSAGLDADGADHLARHVAHGLVFDVAERLRWRHGDAVARVHAHRVDVFYTTYNHYVVGLVAHHLQLELLPAQHRLLDQHLVRRAVAERPRPHLLQLLAVVGDAAAQPAQRERRPEDAGKAERQPYRHHLP